MDFLKIATELIDRIKIILWPVFILTLSLTLLNDRVLEKLALLELVGSYKKWISLGLLVSSAFLITNISKKIVKYIKTWKLERDFKKKMIGNLQRLSDSQNCIVHYLISTNTPSGAYLNMMHPEVNDLQNKGIIYRTSQIGQLTSFAYSLTPDAISILDYSETILNKIAEGYNKDNVDTSMFGEVYF